MTANKRTARIVAVLFLTATATYMLGTGLIGTALQPPDYLATLYPNRFQVISGVLLQYVDAAAVVGIGVLLFPILRKQSEAIALGYAGTRIIECVCLVISGIGTLSLIALSQQATQSGTQSTSSSQTLGALFTAGSNTAYLIGMCALGLGSLPFCYVLYRTRLIPRALAVLGLIGYAALLTGSAVELFGVDLMMIQYLPGGLFELTLPVWLLIKGFNSPVIVTGSVHADVNESERESLSIA